MLVYKDTGEERQPEELVWIYGAKGLSGLIGEVYIFKYTREELAEHFKRKKVRQNVLERRPLEQMNKITGRVREPYKNLRKSLEEYFQKKTVKKRRNITLIRMIEENTEIWKTHYREKKDSVMIIERYMEEYNKRKVIREVKKKYKEESDPITYEKITEPVILLPDWKKGGRQIYNKTTIESLRKYISPFTRAKFTKEDIIECK